MYCDADTLDAGPACAAAVAEVAPWRELRVLACSHNCVADMDASLRLLPALRRLTLTHSNLSTIANLSACTALTRCRALSHLPVGAERSPALRWAQPCVRFSAAVGQMEPLPTGRWCCFPGLMLPGWNSVRGRIRPSASDRTEFGLEFGLEFGHPPRT